MERAADFTLQPFGLLLRHRADFTPQHGAAKIVLTQRVGTATLLRVAAHHDAMNLLLKRVDRKNAQRERNHYVHVLAPAGVQQARKRLHRLCPQSLALGR